MPNERNIILKPRKIRQKLERMAYEIYEDNYKEKEIIIAGINVRGYFVAEKLAGILKKITDLDILLTRLKIKTAAPVQSPVEIESDVELSGKTVIIVDDVANTGRTLLYATKPFLNVIPKKILMAVLVDRQHKTYPVSVDYVGLSLATTIQENINVEINEEDFVSVYLE